MKKIKIFQLILLAFMVIPMMAQKSTVYTDAMQNFKKGKNLYDRGNFGLAQQAFELFVKMDEPENEPNYEHQVKMAHFYKAHCALLLEQEEGESLMLDFVKMHSPDPIANKAIFELGDHYYNYRQYPKAIEFFSMLNANDLSLLENSEASFKKGYCHFVRKEFDEAETSLSQTISLQNEFYFPSNYYYAMCQFFKEDYGTAIRSFDKLARSEKYKHLTPFYLSQIYFAQEEYGKMINYGESVLTNRKTKNQKEIRRLIGQSYFIQGDYTNALPHLEYYASKSGKMLKEDFYQLAYAQYQTGAYDKAVKNFKEIAGQKNEMGQNANYYLADCFLKNNERKSARTAFQSVSKMEYNAEIQEEALFNYGKLSAELGYDKDAVIALQEIEEGSKFHGEAQELLSAVFLNTRNYEDAENIINAMTTKSPTIKAAYQKVTFYKGVQLYNENKLAEAKKYFDKSLLDSQDPSIKAQAIFWKGELAHKQGAYDQSINELTQYFAIARNNALPIESSLFMASYIQGYNYIKLQNFSSAQSFFKEAIQGLKRNESKFSASTYKKMLGDALVRAGDCSFKKNNYISATEYYAEAVNNKYPGFVYAQFQKAMIQGLTGKPYQKVILLEDIAKNYPTSKYADDAFFQLGISYQELGNSSEAISALNQLVDKYGKKSPLTNQAYLRLGLFSFNQGDLNQALRYYKKIFDNNPSAQESQDAVTGIQEIYVDNLGQPEEYVKFIKTVPGMDISEFKRDSINFRSAEIQYENAEYDKAVIALGDYIRSFPRGAYTISAHYFKAESHGLLKDYDAALKEYDFVIQKGQNEYYSKALRKAAIISYNHALKFDKAYNYYIRLEGVASSEEQSFEALMGALRSAYRANFSTELPSLASRIIAHPRASQEDKATAYFFQGKSYFEQANYTEASRAFERVILSSDNVQTAEARYLRALMAFKRNDLGNAERLAQNANKASSSYPFWVAKNLILISDVLVAKKDLFNAKAPLEAIIANFTDNPEILSEATSKLDYIKQLEEDASRLETNPNENNLNLLDTIPFEKSEKRRN